MVSPSWDLFVTIFFIIAIVYGIALGRERAVVACIAAYIGLVFANIGGNYIFSMMGSQGAANIGHTITIAANTTPFALKAGLFAIVTLLLIVKGDFLKKASTAHEGFGSILFAGLYSFLAAGIIITAILSFLPDSDRATLLDGSAMLSQVMQYNVWWMVIPAILMILLGFKQPKED